MCTVPFPRSPFLTHQPRSVSRGRPVPSPPIHYDNKCHTHTHSSPHHNLQPWRWRASVAVMARIPSDGARTPPLQQQQQHNLFSQASWSRLEMKPERKRSISGETFCGWMIYAHCSQLLINSYVKSKERNNKGMFT